MTAQPIDKNQLIDLRYSLKREIIRCNSSGACAASSIILCNTKKWHSLLSIFRENTGSQYVLLSTLDDTIIINNRTFSLSTRKYPFVYFPLGHQYLENITTNPTPVIEYNLLGTTIRKEILLLSTQNTTLIRYTLLNTNQPATIQLRPIVGMRNANALNRKNNKSNIYGKNIENGIAYKSIEHEPTVYLQMSKNSEFVTAPDWNFNIEYSDDLITKLPYQEDLFMPGFFETTLQPNESIIFAASDHKAIPEKFETLFNNEIKLRKPRQSYQDDIEYAATQLIRQRKDHHYIVNSLPEKAEFPKQIFMSLPGLTLPDNPKLFEDIVESLLKQLKNIVFGRGNDYHFSPELPLWFIWAVQQFYYQNGNATYTYKQFGKVVNKIIKVGINDGFTHLSINNNYLLANNISNENRYYVETNALWYNALQFAADINRFNNDIVNAETAAQTAKKVKEAFAKMFILHRLNYLPNSVSEEGNIDNVCKPNQILAAALPYAVVDNNIAEKILKSLETKLLTTRGLLSTPLSENDKNQPYIMPEYSAFLAELYLKLRTDDSGLNMAKQLLFSLNEDNNLPASPCFYSKYRPTPPYEGFESPLCATSIASIKRIKMLIDQY